MTLLLLLRDCTMISLCIDIVQHIGMQLVPNSFPRNLKEQGAQVVVMAMHHVILLFTWFILQLLTIFFCLLSCIVLVNDRPHNNQPLN